MNPVQTLRIDLRAAGVTAAQAEHVCTSYAHALLARTNEHWATFYMLIFLMLQQFTGNTIDWVQQKARESLLLIVEDDFGTELFDAQDLSELRARITGGISEPAESSRLPIQNRFAVFPAPR